MPRYASSIEIDRETDERQINVSGKIFELCSGTGEYYVKILTILDGG